jgi:hypothetical protein
MKQETNESKFKYSYSAPTEHERREIESIKKNYEGGSSENSKISRLRKLDAFVNNSAMAFGISIGVVGILLFGLGLSLVLEWDQYVWGIVTSALGALPIAAAYPVYKFVLKRNKEKYGPEILHLSKELLGENVE